MSAIIRKIDACTVVIAWCGRHDILRGNLSLPYGTTNNDMTPVARPPELFTAYQVHGTM